MPYSIGIVLIIVIPPTWRKFDSEYVETDLWASEVGEDDTASLSATLRRKESII